MNKARIFAGLAAVSLAMGTAACGGPAEDTAVEAPPEGPAGITVTDGRFNMPTVAGNPGALYFTIANADAAATSILVAEVIGAGRAELHQTAQVNGAMTMQETLEVPVPAGETVKFAPGGLHVMAFDLDPSMAVGGETEVTLTFSNNDKLSFPVKILAAGDEGGDEGGDKAAMDHSGH